MTGGDSLSFKGGRRECFVCGVLGEQMDVLVTSLTGRKQSLMVYTEKMLIIEN